MNTTNFEPQLLGSPYARSAQRYIDNGLSVIPIAPGTKMPGEYAAGRWRGMNGWGCYATRMPTELELDLWQKWPDAGIGLMMGPLTQVIGVDVDTEDTLILKAINEILPPSPVRKKGKKGWTSFYKYNGEVNKSWRINGKPLIDLLSEGRQTLMPGTIHPDGMTYVYITEDTLDTIDLSQLPDLPKNFNELMAKIIEPLMTEEDRKHLRHQDGPKDIEGEIPAPSGFAAGFFRKINTQALHRLDEWVPAMIPTAKAVSAGYRCRAFWRDAQNLNVGIARTGIKDHGGDYGMTPIDLVMFAHNVTFPEAAEALRKRLNISLGEEPTFKLGQHHAPPPAPKPVVVEPIVMESAGPMAAAREAVRREEESKRHAEENAKEAPDFLLQAPGMLGRIAGWMAQTAPKYQPELFIGAALALGATAMGRQYRTSHGNWPSLYLVMVAKSGEGKEHPQQCVANILAAAGLDKLVAGAGYTSPGAVHTTLMRFPSHIAIIDEIGKMLKISRLQGSANSEAAIDKLVEAYGKNDGFMKPQVYSAMSMSATQIAQLADKTVHNPAITLLGATTPDTFYQSLTSDLVGDGFMGRLIVVQSKQPAQMGRLPMKTPPPTEVVDWVRAVHEEAAGDLVNYMNPAIPAAPVVMAFDPGALELLDDFERKLTFELKPKAEAVGLEALLVRTREKAMRVSMIVAKAMNAPKDNTIRRAAVEWAIKYVEYNDVQAIKAVETEGRMTWVETEIKKFVRYIARATQLRDSEEMIEKVLALGAVPRQKLIRAMKLDVRAFDSVINTAIEQGRIFKTDGAPTVGFSGAVYWLRGKG